MPAAAKLTKGVNPFRKDPKPRHLDGSAVWSRLKNEDPNKRYVFVNKGDVEALAEYECAGYEVEVLTEHGVRPMGGRTGKVGEPVEVRGMILHSVSRGRFDEIQMHGMNGNAGQTEADRIEQQIVAKRGFDPLRGMHSSFIHLTKEIQAPENEVITNG